MRSCHKKSERGPCNQRGTWRKPEAMQVKMPTPTYRSVVIYHNRAWDTRPVGLLFTSSYGQTNEKYKEDSRKSSTAYRKPITYSRASNFGSKNEMWFIGIIPWFDGLGRLRYLDLDSILQACIGIARFFCARFLTRTTWRREIGEKRAKQPGV